MTQEYTHGQPHLFSRPDRIDEPLYVCCTVFNATRYRTRWKLFQDFARMVEASGAVLYVCEVAFGERAFSVTSPDNPRHLQLRTNCEIWHKERALSLLIQRLPADWKYLTIADTDITFARGDWANEILHQLQHYLVLQPWSESVDLSPDYEIMNTFRSFAWCYKNGVEVDIPGDYYQPNRKKHKNYFHPGYVWSFRRDAYDGIGGLIDWTVAGGGDLLMARSFSGIQRQLPESLGPSGRRWLEIYQKRCDEVIKRNLGYVPGLLLHHFHGKKRDRRYSDRGMILTNANFDPEKDLYVSSTGLYELNPHNIELRDGLRNYFRGRNEDSIDID